MNINLCHFVINNNILFFKKTAMQSANQIKHFTCQLHPSETIQRVCLDSSAASSLKCIECILNGTENVSKDSLIALNEFVDNAARHYQTFRRISSFETTTPDELINFLAKEEENIQKLSQHVEQEKKRVNVSFNPYRGGGGWILIFDHFFPSNSFLMKNFLKIFSVSFYLLFALFYLKGLPNELKRNRDRAKDRDNPSYDPVM